MQLWKAGRYHSSPVRVNIDYWFVVLQSVAAARPAVRPAVGAVGLPDLMSVPAGVIDLIDQRIVPAVAVVGLPDLTSVPAVVIDLIDQRTVPAVGAVGLTVHPFRTVAGPAPAVVRLREGRHIQYQYSGRFLQHYPWMIQTDMLLRWNNHCMHRLLPGEAGGVAIHFLPELNRRKAGSPEPKGYCWQLKDQVRRFLC